MRGSDSYAPRRNARRHVVSWIAVACLLIIIALLYWRSHDERPGQATLRQHARDPVQSSAMSPAVPTGAPQASLPFRITRVSIDKPEVCRGERTVVRINATYDDGKTGWLVPVINGRVGWAVAVTVPHGSPGTYDIPVRIGDPDRGARGEPVAYTEAGASIVLKDCDTPSTLWLTSTQRSALEENVSLRATWLPDHPVQTAPGREPSVYVWDFGDGSARIRTRSAEVVHAFPGEDQRGPGQRVFTYLVRAELLDPGEHTLATGVLDVSFRNHIEELKYTDHRLQLRAEFDPHANVDPDGSAYIDVVLKNLDPEETAKLTDLELRRVPCAADGSTSVEARAVSDVFDGVSLPPRGTISGRLRWSSKAADVCNIDVSAKGRSEPGGLVVGANFSMRVRLDQDFEQVREPSQADEIRKAMALLHKTHVTLEDLAPLVEAGQISEVVLHPPGPPRQLSSGP